MSSTKDLEAALHRAIMNNPKSREITVSSLVSDPAAFAENDVKKVAGDVAGGLKKRSNMKVMIEVKSYGTIFKVTVK